MKLVLTIFCAGELGQNAEGAGLGGAGSRVPVLRVLNQTLLAGIARRGHVNLGLHVRFPVQSEQPRNDDCTDMESICVLN